MPELPEVETVLQTLKHQILGRTIVSVTVLWNNIIVYPSIEQFERNLAGHHFSGFGRRGKYLIFDLDDVKLICHLRMEGKFYINKASDPIDKHTHVVFDLDDGTQLRYHDVRKFGKMWLYQKDEPLHALEKLGFEPWDERLTPDCLHAIAHQRKTTLKQLLLDQGVIAGIGNIYADEICFACGILPMKRCNRLNRNECRIIIENTRRILKEAICQGGTTIRTYASSLGVSGRFQQSLLVHRRNGEPCARCGQSIVKTKVATRGTYYCPGCQKR